MDIEAIKASVRLDALVRESVPDLQERSPGDYWGRCPFHDEDTPSFHVRTRVGRYKCFGCGASGDVLAFVIKAKKLDFRAAIAYVAARAGLIVDSARCAPPASRPSARPALHPHPEAVASLIAATTRTDQDDQASTWLASRGLDATKVADASLARVIPRGADVPHWAYCKGRSWPASGYRVLVPMFAARGQTPASVRARRILAGEPKAVAPRGHAVRGVVMANQLARHLLAKGPVLADWPADQRLRIAIAEGEPDFLTLATYWHDQRWPPAVVGVVSGSWTPEIADCIPSGALVEVCTDPDLAGDFMAHAISASLGSRCEVVRVVPAGSRP